jgi:hypothetical protein
VIFTIEDCNNTPIKRDYLYNNNNPSKEKVCCLQRSTTFTRDGRLLHPFEIGPVSQNVGQTAIKIFILYLFIFQNKSRK